MKRNRNGEVRSYKAFYPVFKTHKLNWFVFVKVTQVKVTRGWLTIRKVLIPKHK